MMDFGYRGPPKPAHLHLATYHICHEHPEALQLAKTPEAVIRTEDDAGPRAG